MILKMIIVIKTPTALSKNLQTFQLMFPYKLTSVIILYNKILLLCSPNLQYSASYNKLCITLSFHNPQNTQEWDSTKKKTSRIYSAHSRFISIQLTLPLPHSLPFWWNVSVGQNSDMPSQYSGRSHSETVVRQIVATFFTYKRGIKDIYILLWHKWKLKNYFTQFNYRQKYCIKIF